MIDIFDTIKGVFRKKEKIIAYFCDETGTFSRKAVKYENNIIHIKQWGRESKAYIVDHNFIMHEKSTGLPVTFYYTNNPRPVRIQHERNSEVDSIGFKKILDSKTIQDLFSNEGQNLLTLLMILIIVNMVISAVIVAVQFHLIKVPAAST